jgi:hypothetical protein
MLINGSSSNKNQTKTKTKTNKNSSAVDDLTMLNNENIKGGLFVGMVDWLYG